MGWFKRLCLFVFGLAGVLSLAALSLTLVGPWTTMFRSWLFETTWYFMVLEVLVCIAGVGALACVLASLFAPRNPRETIIAKVDGGQITVTRAAIVSQAKHSIEDDGSCIASSVRVKVRKRGHVRVSARVKPRYPMDLVAQGEKLYAALQEGLAHVCGDNVKSISVVFGEPDQPDAPFAPEDEGDAATSQQSVSAESITVPMSAVAKVADDVEQQTEDSRDPGEPLEYGEPKDPSEANMLDQVTPDLEESSEPAQDEADTPADVQEEV